MSKVEDCRPSDLTMLYGRVKQFNDNYCKGRKGKLSVSHGTYDFYNPDYNFLRPEMYKLVYRGKALAASDDPSALLNYIRPKKLSCTLDDYDKYIFKNK